MSRRAYPVLALCGTLFYAGPALSQVGQVDNTLSLRFPVPQHQPTSGDAQYVFDTISNTTLARFEVSLGSDDILHNFLGSVSPEIQSLIVEYIFPGRTLIVAPESVLVAFSRHETRPVGPDEEYPARSGGSARAELMLNDTDRATFRVRSWKKAQQRRVYVGNDDRGLSRAGGDPIIREGVVGLQNRRVVAVVEIEEWSEAWLPTGGFLSLVWARKIEGKVNNVDLRLPERAVQGLREFASHMNPLTPPDE